MRQTHEQMRLSIWYLLSEEVCHGERLDPYLADNFLLLRWLPFEIWVIAVNAFVLRDGLVELFVDTFGDESISRL